MLPRLWARSPFVSYDFFAGTRKNRDKTNQRSYTWVFDFCLLLTNNKRKPFIECSVTGFHVDAIVEKRHIQKFRAFAGPFPALLFPMSMPIASTTLAVNNLTNINGNANFNVQANKQLHHQAVDSPARSSMTATTAANSNSNSSRDDYYCRPTLQDRQKNRGRFLWCII